MRIERNSGTSTTVSWRFVMPDGTPHKPWYTAEALPRLLLEQVERQSAADRTSLQGVTASMMPKPRRSGRVGLGSGSTCTPASKPCSR